jgi:hypothetical protein
VTEPLNELSGKEWIKFTRSWFVCDSPRYWKNKPTELHPARYPEELVADFLRFFTKPGEWVLDPFLGSGATLVACMEEGRNGLGIELSSRYATVSQKRLAQRSLGLCQLVLQADARDTARTAFWKPFRPELEKAGLPFHRGLPRFHFAMTSPPYWKMLRTSRGGVLSKHKQRIAAGLDDRYSDDPADLGNINSYDEFIEAAGRIFDGVRRCLMPGRYLVVVVQNQRTPDGEVKPLAWDLARRLCKGGLAFQGERIWCQNTKRLGIWGYPKIFVPNYHHHYCLIFRRALQP